MYLLTGGKIFEPQLLKYPTAIRSINILWKTTSEESIEKLTPKFGLQFLMFDFSEVLGENRTIYVAR